MNSEENGNGVKKVQDIKVNRHIKTIARVNNVEIMEKAIDTEKFKGLGVDLAFCPDQMAA